MNRNRLGRTAKRLNFHTRRLLMFPSVIALLRLQEFARRAAGYKGPWTLSATAELSQGQAGASYNEALVAALGQLLVVPGETRAQILQQVATFGATATSLDGLAPLFLTSWSAVLRSGNIAACQAPALLWDTLAPRLLLHAADVPVVDVIGRSVLFYDAKTLPRLRLGSIVSALQASSAYRGSPGRSQNRASTDGGDLEGDLGSNVGPVGSLSGGGLGGGGLGGGGLGGGGLGGGGLGGGGLGGGGLGGGGLGGGGLGGGGLGGGGLGGGGLGGGGLGGGGLGGGGLGGGGLGGGGLGGGGPGGGGLGGGGLGGGGPGGGGLGGGGLGGQVFGGLQGAIPGMGFGGIGLQAGQAEDGGGLCRGIATYGGAFLGFQLGARLGGIGGSPGGPPGVIGGIGLGAIGGTAAGMDIGRQLGQDLCGGSGGTTSGSSSGGGSSDQLQPGDYTDPTTGYDYQVTSDGHTVSGDTSGAPATYLGEVDSPGFVSGGGTGTSGGSGGSGDAGNSGSGNDSGQGTYIGEADDPNFVSGGEKPNPDSNNKGGEKPNPDGSGSGERPSPDATGSGGPRGYAEKPAPDSNGGGGPHSRGAVAPASTTFVEGTAAESNVVRMSAARYELLNVPQLGIGPGGRLRVLSLGVLAARPDVAAIALQVNALM